MGVAAIPTWNQVGANWPHDIFYGQLVPFGALWPFGHFWPQAISCHHWPPWPISISPTPRPSSLILGLGGPFIFSGPPGPPEPKLATNSLDPKLAKDLLDTNLAINSVGPIFGHGPPWTNISAMASGNHQISSVSLPLNLWGIPSIPSYHPYWRFQAWCIYGIIYHYAPLLLSNAMVTFSGPNSTNQYQGLKIQCPS
ncbi:hypothetical protein O181_024104 [Austropuccinia psidii MF-1]|uniref:Uncharacterized protein n=1 Tax=Austropuccinia psidii MF-1 TaxID=1389203 RepID=A0A9Q3GZC0_9BASI|nr:hypothetical protein [Austropuccinia psidii MF-1]